jgi:hypothetical protein
MEAGGSVRLNKTTTIAMPPKRSVTGLQRVGCEWVSYTLNVQALPSDWSEIEASQHPEPWLDSRPNLHALRRMAIMADAGAVRLLLSLQGSDGAKEQQILERAGQDKAADRATKAAQSALAYLTCNPPQPATRKQEPLRADDPDSSDDGSP